MCTTSKQNTTQESGLLHLVEAATALTQLVDTPRVQSKQTAPPSQSKSAPPTHPAPANVSDDEESQPKPSTIRCQTEVIPRVVQPSPPLFSPAILPELSPREIFPQRLMSVLSDRSVSDIISWLPHGRSFVILRPDVFAARIMPVYFGPETGKPAPPSSTFKYPSFTRKLNRWGFRQMSRGPDAGAFHHDLFRRDEPELCRKMVCQKSRRPKSTKCARTTSPASSGTASDAQSPTDSAPPPKKRKLSVPQPPKQTIPLSLAPTPATPRTVSCSSDSLQISPRLGVSNQTTPLRTSSQNIMPLLNRQFLNGNPSVFHMANLLPVSVPQPVVAPPQAAPQTTTQHSPIAPRPPRRTSITQRIPYTEDAQLHTLPKIANLQNGQPNADSAKSMLYKAYMQALRA